MQIKTQITTADFADDTDKDADDTPQMVQITQIRSADYSDDTDTPLNTRMM